MKKGFTLVELLAVIVILAVIALITIPAVMKMIDNATTNSYRRSIDLYGRAVNNAIISYQTEMVEKGSSSNVTFENIDPYIEYEGNDVECNNKIIYSDKTILLTECSVDEELVYGEKGKGYGDNNYYYYTNSKKKMKLIEYIKAVEEAIEDKNISGTCTIGEDKITCNNEEMTIKSNLENAIEGSLIIENNKVKSYSNLKFATEKKVLKQEEIPEVVDEIIIEPDENSNTQNNDNQNNNNNNQDNNIQSEPKICKSKSGSVSTELGTEYECEVKSGTKYNFYVLSVDGDKVNLIMDRNICEDGTINYTSMNNYCRYEWHEYVSMNYDTPPTAFRFGPETAMYVLHNATKTWKNVPDIIIDYDHSADGGPSYNAYGYSKIKTDSTTKKTRILGPEDVVLTEIGSKNYPMKARLSTKKELTDVGCSLLSNSCPSWINKNLDSQNIKGYWIFTISDVVDHGSYVDIDVYNISQNGLYGNDYESNNVNGVRPVITVKINNLY